MLPRVQSVQLFVFAALASLAPACAHAAEIVTLQSGFTIRCASREPLSQTTIRLHMRSTGDADNYMDIPASSIAAVETTPDEVPAAAALPQAKTFDTSSILADSGARHNVNVALLAAVVHAESAGNAHAVSRTGAQGLMQLMPGTAAGLGVKDSFDPASNVNGGSAYLDALLRRYHDNLPLALAAYNAGPAAVDRYHGIPPFRETQAYVARVIREFNRRVAQEKTASSTVAAR
ncbi:soluble lytic murein transglycosylase-like protein [Terriglobus roseus DSM 18391]|uniref:Soluble lytic murein transglycosylase-like protein n=1 Tax=Terriglobus roseus (strain DSM 18391 / NRRL B-41598 / KBS 63) TaxID=926566 RepID=I3ZJT0_TERRK|nr:lytic transglycosylase domain-containing protein [Terriglobus roseus]AFL89498.1 soluble lytic murein transglycosylase-like protein [Terriglobus roseus DSM 18391]